jgi:hypothetical protein
MFAEPGRTNEVVTPPDAIIGIDTKEFSGIFMM